MNLVNREGNCFITPEDQGKLHEGLKILVPLKTKYFKLGKIIASSNFPIETKNQFFSFGREMDKLLSLWKTFGEIK